MQKRKIERMKDSGNKRMEKKKSEREREMERERKRDGDGERQREKESEREKGRERERDREFFSFVTPSHQKLNLNQSRYNEWCKKAYLWKLSCCCEMSQRLRTFCCNKWFQVFADRLIVNLWTEMACM